MAAIDRQDPRYLTGNQQDLLRAALVSNNPTSQSSSQKRGPTAMAALQNPYATIQSLQGPDVLNTFDFDNSEFSGYIDGDTSFDFDASEIANLNDDEDVKEVHDKRKASDDDDDDDPDAKRGEGEDKQPKKPGRKPLTSEPTTKRKAQNRAAQRAFRERKEKHLKDLETKVEQLTKTSEVEKQENGALRAQVERLQSELKEYKRRMATDGNRRSQPSLANGISMPNRNEFAFEFPVFGSLPGNQIFGTTGAPTAIKREGSDSPKAIGQTSRHNSSSQSPMNRSNKPVSPSSAPRRADSQASNGIQNFAGLFSPGLLNGVAASTGNSPDYGFPRGSNSPQTQNIQDNGTDTNSGLSRVFRFNSESATSNTDSPSQSSMSNFNATSSCDTSPGPSHPSPPKDAPNSNPGLTNHDVSSSHSLSTPSTVNGIDWLASQNGGGFDPVLFGDYRESQDAIVGDGEFNNGFFNDAFPFDFGSPLNFGINSPKPAPNTINGQKVKPNPANVKIAAQEKSQACQNLLSQVEKCSGGDDDSSSGTIKPTSTLLSANTIWNQLQGNKDFQEGKFDLDGLCSELRAKAKCSESGVVVPASDVDVAFKKMCGQGNPPPDYPNQDPNLVWNGRDVDDAIHNLGGDKVNWGGFGLN